METPSIFINYRRTDVRGYAALVERELVERYGSKRVFRDTNSIPAGQHFPVTLKQAVEKCSVCLVLIGPDWVDERLRDPSDWVHHEIVTAFEAGRPVIPVLLGNARIPSAD